MTRTQSTWQVVTQGTSRDSWVTYLTGNSNITLHLDVYIWLYNTLKPCTNSFAWNLWSLLRTITCSPWQCTILTIQALSKYQTSIFNSSNSKVKGRMFSRTSMAAPGFDIHRCLEVDPHIQLDGWSTNWSTPPQKSTASNSYYSYSFQLTNILIPFEELTAAAHALLNIQVPILFSYRIF